MHCTGEGECSCPHWMTSYDLMEFYTNSPKHIFFQGLHPICFIYYLEGIIVFRLTDIYTDHPRLINWMADVLSLFIGHLKIMWLKPFYCLGSDMHAKVSLLLMRKNTPLAAIVLKWIESVENDNVVICLVHLTFQNRVDVLFSCILKSDTIVLQVSLILVEHTKTLHWIAKSISTKLQPSQ